MIAEMQDAHDLPKILMASMRPRSYDRGNGRHSNLFNCQIPLAALSSGCRFRLQPVFQKLSLPLLNTTFRATGGVLQVKEKDMLAQEIRLNEICQLNLIGNIQLSTQAVNAL